MNYKFSSLIFLLILRSEIICCQENTTNSCENDWILIPGHGCFLFELERKLDMMEAQVYCENNGAFLPEMIDDELEEILVEYAIQIGDEDSVIFWLGGTDLGHEGDWIWQHSDTKTTEFFWADEQPNASTTFNCLTLTAEYGSELGWYDTKCEGWTYSTICQKPIGS